MMILRIDEGCEIEGMLVYNVTSTKVSRHVDGKGTIGV